MSTSKTSGRTDQVIGDVKHAAGKVFGNEELQAKGEAQKHKGEASVKAAEAKDTVEGNAKSIWGNLTGDKKKEAEGDVQKQSPF